MSTQQPSVTPQTPPVQQPPTMESVPEKKPIFSIIAGVIVIVAIAGYIALASFYNLWPFSYTEPEMEAVPTPRAGEVMKTYTNEDYGFKFEFEYPSGGEVVMLDYGVLAYKGSELVKDIEEHPGRYAGDAPGDAFITIADINVDQTIRDAGSQFNDREEEIEQITINGVPATKATVWATSSPDWIWKGIFIESGYNDIIVYIGNGSNLEGDKEFEQLYKSFELIESDMSDWKTYNNSTYGYSVSYPPEWTVAEYGPKRVVIGSGSDTMAIRLMSLSEFSEYYGAVVPEETITLTSGLTAYRFVTIEETAVIVVTYVEHEGGYLLATYLVDRAQAEQIVQSLEINQ